MLSYVIFAAFWLSGFAGLLYQTVWLRLAYSSFGAITPVLSVVLSVFMLGLALGSWLGGKTVKGLSARLSISPLWLYVFLELFIGAGAFAVPAIFKFEETLLQSVGPSDSLAYLFYSAMLIAVAILPWCTAMGCTFPFMLSFLEKHGAGEKTFSYLYLSNLLGALTGTLLTAFVLVELLGFHKTLMFGAFFNLLICLLLFAYTRLPKADAFAFAAKEKLSDTTSTPPDPQALSLGTILLWTTGITSMAMEVLWIRIFSPLLGNAIYSFATILFAYLMATAFGARRYRKHLAQKTPVPVAQLLGSMAIAALLPALLNDAHLLNLFVDNDAWTVFCVLIALLSIYPICFLFGYLTPLVIDTQSRGDPEVAGRAYAFNCLGCIFGPPLASYLLLPVLGARLSIVLLALPFFLLYLRGLPLFSTHTNQIGAANPGSAGSRRQIALFALMAAIALFFSHSYEESLSPHAQVFRDHTATVVAYGEGMGKELSVNGRKMTNLRPFIKMMAHLPLALHQGPVHSTLMICFGMGTTYRSLLSWGVDATTVELVPGVIKAFPYFHEDANAIFANPQGKVVVDDGRRFLARSHQKFDIITIDPPPPVEAAGSSLLYSQEFYHLLKLHLNPNGIVQQWFGSDEPKLLPAIARAIKNTFAYVRVFHNQEGWGYHFLASESPIPNLSAEQIVARMPDAAKKDMVEWDAFLGNKDSIEQTFARVLSLEVPIGSLLDNDTNLTITDDRPINEYCFLRRLSSGDRKTWHEPAKVFTAKDAQAKEKATP